MNTTVSVKINVELVKYNFAFYMQDSGDILWTYKCPKPVFSSPVLLTSGDGIVVGCVDGGVHVIGCNGQQVS